MTTNEEILDKPCGCINPSRHSRICVESKLREARQDEAKNIFAEIHNELVKPAYNYDKQDKFEKTIDFLLELKKKFGVK